MDWRKSTMINASFWDIRDQGYMRIATISPQIVIGNPEANMENHLYMFFDVVDQGAQVVVGPELGLTGYTAQDLFKNRTLYQRLLKALKELLAKTAETNAIFVVGMPIRVDQRLYNCVVVIRQGKILAIIPKSYLPEYNEFREGKWFSPARHLKRKAIRLCGQSAPIGADILIEHTDIEGAVFHFSICEDWWAPVAPHTRASLAGATILIGSHTSNEIVGKDNWVINQIMRPASGTNPSIAIYCSSGNGESTTDVVMGGRQVIAENGNILASTDTLLKLNGDYLIHDVDLWKVVHDRQNFHTAAYNSLDVESDFRVIEISGELGCDNSEVYIKPYRHFDPMPFVPDDKTERLARTLRIFSIQTQGLVTRLRALRPANQMETIQGTFGISGGLDSALSAIIISRACDILGIPKSNIIALTMPGFGTTSGTKNNAIALATQLGFTLIEEDITAICLDLFERVGHDGQTEDLPFENMQAQVRKQLEVAWAAMTRGIVIGTGDWSEGLIGWTTKHGDWRSDYNPNGSLPKTLVQFVVESAALEIFTYHPQTQQVLFDILATPISPELKRPRLDGTIAQETEQVNGPYILTDFYGYWFERYGLNPQRIAWMAYWAFQQIETPFTLQYLKDRFLGRGEPRLNSFINQVFTAQHKRDDIPPSPQLGLSLSTRYYRQMAAEADNTIWREDAESIPTEVPLEIQHATREWVTEYAR